MLGHDADAKSALHSRRRDSSDPSRFPILSLLYFCISISASLRDLGRCFSTPGALDFCLNGLGTSSCSPEVGSQENFSLPLRYTPANPAFEDWCVVPPSFCPRPGGKSTRGAWFSSRPSEALRLSLGHLLVVLQLTIFHGNASARQGLYIPAIPGAAALTIHRPLSPSSLEVMNPRFRLTWSGSR